MIRKYNQESESMERISVFRDGRSLYFFNDVDNHSVSETFRLIQQMEQESSKKPIRFIINSKGGSLYDGLALYDRIKISPCKIIMVATGLVASMGLVIYLAGDERVITETATLLSHQNLMDLEHAKTADVKIEAREMERLEDWYLNLVSNITGQSVKKIEEGIKIGDKYISAEEAVKTGYASKIIEYKEML